MTVASINDAVATHSTGFMGYSQAACTVALPTLSSTYNDPNGNGYFYIYNMRMGLSGKDASRTVALAIWNTSNTILKETASFTVAAASSASLTAYKSLTSNLLIKRNGSGAVSSVRMGFWVSGSGSVYFQRDATGQTVDINYDGSNSTSADDFGSSGTLWTDASLVGDYNYYTLPAAPSGLSATAGNAQVTLSWVAPNNGGTAITGYKIEKADDSGFTTGLTSTTQTGTSYVWTGLTNGNTYYFRVAAINAVATAASTTSKYSGTASAAPTSGATPPEAPGSFVFGQQTPQSATGLRGSWTAPYNGGSAITGYTMRYSTVADMSTYTDQATGSTATSYNLNGLEANTVYYAQVAAINAIGTGPYTTVEMAETYTPAPPDPTGTGVIKKWNQAAGVWSIIM